MYIGLISDTHGVFSQEFKDFLEPVDQIWHAGDFGGGLKLAKEIADFKPLVGVVGNCDDFILRYDHPPYRFFDFAILRYIARKSIKALFAFPSMAGAVIAIFI